jgi:DNA-binding beta-propeller fold protein YncE
VCTASRARGVLALGAVAIACLALALAPTAGAVVDPPLVYSQGLGNARLLAAPLGVAVDPAGNVWVTSSEAGRVLEFSRAGLYLGRLSSDAGPGKLTHPRGIAADSAGDVWVVDAGNARLVEFSPDGQYLRQIRPLEAGRAASAPFAVVAAGWRVWATYPQEDLVREFSQSGRFLRKFGEPGSGAGQLSWPLGIAADGAGRVWVADSLNARVEQFSPNGRYSDQFHLNGPGAGSSRYPLGLAVDAHDDVWVALFGHLVQEFKRGSTGAYQYAGAVGQPGSGEGQLSFPWGLATGSEGELYVSDAVDDVVQKWAPPRAPAGPPPPGSGCTLYASTSGSDRNPGTSEDQALRTVQHLVQALEPGQTGCLVSGDVFTEAPEWGVTRSGQSREREQAEEAAVAHGEEGRPITITSTQPQAPATIDGRIVTKKGADWLTFTHLVLRSDSAPGVDELPSPTIGSAHTSWVYDDVSGGDVNICFSPTWAGDPYGTGRYTLIEHDRIHDCGHPYTLAEYGPQDTFEGRLSGYHAHGIYDEGEYTTIRNNYIYDNSGNGVLLRAGHGAVVEHNVIDHNGHGVQFGNENATNDTVAWNIITNSTSPCSFESAGRGCNNFGVFYDTDCEVGHVCALPTYNAFANNDVFGNEEANIPRQLNPPAWISLLDNVEVQPPYVDGAAHDYGLLAGPLKDAGYGVTSPPVEW